jgi:hypothetical protein
MNTKPLVFLVMLFLAIIGINIAFQKRTPQIRTLEVRASLERISRCVDASFLQSTPSLRKLTFNQSGGRRTRYKGDAHTILYISPSEDIKITIRKREAGSNIRIVADSSVIGEIFEQVEMCE